MLSHLNSPQIPQLDHEPVGPQVRSAKSHMSSPAIGAAPKAGSSGDPVGTGLVASLAKPGGNVTGLSVQQPDPGKRLEFLREVRPGLQLWFILTEK
jgi:putative ABC transport system substrate-binding protein